MEKVYTIQKNILIVGDENIVFDFPIDYCVQIDDMIIVLLNMPPKHRYNENVFGVSISEKKIKWQIEPREFRLQPFTLMDCQYSDIVTHGRLVRLNNWCDTFLLVNPVTGEVLYQEETK